ncbi:MAG: hypothetical protein C0404_12925 [Verrucomicrobia bacterium]|nr:hypothetical protein [Verrucomicrobiota bacterium]
MKSNDSEVSLAWRKAGEVLHIRVEAPFVLKASDGTYCHFAVYLPDFGGKKEAVLLVAESPAFEHDVKAEACAKQHGYWYSTINRDSYGTFDRESFVATLDDFLYFGSPEDKPDWYTGRPWTK